MLGDGDRIEKQVSVLKKSLVLGFHLLGDSDRFEKQVSVLKRV